MLSADEQPILRQIEHDLRHDDRWFGWHLAMVRIRDLRPRRSARVCLVIELALVWWLPPPEPPDGRPSHWPPTLGYW